MSEAKILLSELWVCSLAKHTSLYTKCIIGQSSPKFVWVRVRTRPSAMSLSEVRGPPRKVKWLQTRRFTREVHRAKCLYEATVNKFKRYGQSNIHQVLYFMLRKSMIDRHAAMITKYECHGCNPKLCRSSMTVEVDFADPRSGHR